MGRPHGGGAEEGLGEARAARGEERRGELGRGPRGGRPWPGTLGAGGRPRAHVEPCMSLVLLQNFYYLSVKSLYTVGYSTSLVTLTTAMVILCRFR